MGPRVGAEGHQDPRTRQTWCETKVISLSERSRSAKREINVWGPIVAMMLFVGLSYSVHWVPSCPKLLSSSPPGWGHSGLRGDWNRSEVKLDYTRSAILVTKAFSILGPVTEVRSWAPGNYVESSPELNNQTQMLIGKRNKHITQKCVEYCLSYTQKKLFWSWTVPTTVCFSLPHFNQHFGVSGALWCRQLVM